MHNCEYSPIKILVYSLVLIGALNWGLVGAFKFDLVAFLLGDMTIAARVVYMLVGLAALAKIGYVVKAYKK